MEKIKLGRISDQFDIDLDLECIGRNAYRGQVSFLLEGSNEDSDPVVVKFTANVWSEWDGPYFVGYFSDVDFDHSFSGDDEDYIDSLIVEKVAEGKFESDYLD